MLKNGKKVPVPPHEPETPLMGPEDIEKDIMTSERIQKEVKAKREKAQKRLKKWGLA